MPIDRRSCLAALAATFATPLRAADGELTRRTAHGFSCERPGGKPIALAALGGPALVVNTATACGFAPQLTGLEQIHLRFSARGLTVLAVPSNDFGQQEPLADHHVEEAMRANFGITFPVAAIARVSGPEAHPFYRWAAAEMPGEAPRWNFHKYLVGRDGALLAAFPSPTQPTDPRVIRAIADALAPS